MTSILVRQATESDAESFLDLWDALDTETEFMLFEPNERKATLVSQKQRLSNALKSENVRILVLENANDKKVVGFCAGRRSGNCRDKHSLHIVIGIKQSYTGKKLGRKLLEELEGWAKTMDIRRLELDVMTNNTRAISLYRNLGYEIEGTRKNSVRLKSGFIDEYVMAKLI